MREYDVTVCSEECGACEFDFALMQWTQEVEGFTRLSEPPITTWRTVTGCSECMTRLGTSKDGRPWRERMVPRAALEWLAEEVADICVCCGEDAEAQTWVAAALKAAEEGDSDE